MGSGDLVKSLFGDEIASEELSPRVVRRRRSSVDAQQLRSLPRARGEHDLVRVRDPRISFDDLLLNEDVRSTFGRLHLELSREDRLAQYGVPPRRKLLFTGPPGCGKTATSEALADELGRQFATVNLATLVSSFLGDTSKNLASIFEAASVEPWVLVLDEFDAVAKERADKSDHGELQRVVTAFIQILDEFSGPSVVVATTNHPGILDSAVWRRFDEVIEFAPPSVHELRALLRLKLRSIPKEKNLDVDRLARQASGLSHADVSAAVTSALRTAVLRDEDVNVTPHDLMDAIETAQQRVQIGSRASSTAP